MAVVFFTKINLTSMKFQLKTNNLSQNFIEYIQKEIPYLPSEYFDDILIGLGEVIQNIIRHAYKNHISENDFIDIKYQITDNRLIINLRDYAEPCHPKSFLNRHFLPNESGHMGLSIIRKLTDEFSIQPLADGNETKLVFKLSKLNEN